MWYRRLYLIDRIVSFLRYLKEMGDHFITKIIVNSDWKLNQGCHINITLEQINKALRWVIAALIIF